MLEKSTLKQRPPVYNLLSQLLLWDQPLSRFIQYTTFTLSSIQCILILLAYQLVFIANSDHDSFADYLSKLCKILSLIDISDFEKHETVIEIILGVGIVYVLIFLTPFILSLKQFWDDREFSQGKKIFCIYFGLIHCGLGFWILNALIMSYLNFGFNLGGAGIVFGCIVLTALNYLLAFYFAVYSYDPFIGSNALSCHSRIFQIMLFGFKAVAAPIIFLADNSSKAANWTFVILSVLLLGVRHFELMKRFPYYNYATMKLAIILHTCKIWIALVSFLALTETSEYFLSGKVLVYIEAPTCSLAVRMMLDIFHQMIFSSFSSNQDSKSLSEMMRKIFGILYLIERTKPTCPEGAKRSLNEINFFGALVAKNNEKYLIGESMDKNEKMTQILRGILEDTIERFNTNQQLRIMRTDMMLNQINFPFEVSMMSLGELKKLQGGGARLVTIKLYEKLQDKLTSFFEENRETVLDLKRFLEYETASANLNNSIENGIKHYKNYWNTFLNPNLKIQNFFLKSKGLEKIAEDIESQWKKSAGNNKYFAGAFCNMYSLFLHLLRGSPFHAQIIRQKYPQTRINAESEDCFSNEYLLSPNTLTIHASLTKENPGKILKLSSNFEELSGWRANEILGHSVNILMPPFMAYSHNKLLLNHLKKLQIGQNSPRMYKTLKSFLMHKSGYMLACDVYLSLHPIVQDSPVYIVFLKVKSGMGEQILLNEDGEIEGFTKKIGNLLHLETKTKNQFETICANFPDVQIALEKFKQDEPLSLEEGIHFRLPSWRNAIQYPANLSSHIFDNQLYFSLSLDFDASSVQEKSFPEVPEEFSHFMTSNSPHPFRVLSSPVSSLKPLKLDFRKTEGEDGEKNLLCSSDRNFLVKTRKDDQIEELELKDIESLVGSFSKHSVTKFERALKIMPTNPQVCLLYLSFIFLMVISGITLIIFQQKASTTLDQIHSSGEVISNLIFRLVRYTDVYAYSRILWQANIGLTELDRYDQYGYTINTINYNIDVMAKVLEDIRERNEGIRSFVYRLDPKLSHQIYSDLVPVYEIQPNGAITQTREDNLFDLTTELVATGTKFLYSGMAFDENNPYMIFLLNNTMNEPLLAGQRELPILMDDNESKLNDLSIYTYMMIVVTFGLAIAIFIYFKNLVRKFIKERGQFIFVFTNIDEKYIHEHLRLLEDFHAIFHKTSQSKAHLMETQSGQKSSSKKAVDNKGINRTLYLIYLALITFLFGICSVSPIISILVKKSSKTILKKLDLMAESNYIFYNLLYFWNIVNAYAQYGVYEYEHIKGKPLVEAIKAAAEGVLGVQDFFINHLLDPENGMSDNSFLYNTAVGDLCDLYSFSDEILESLCPTLGGGAATKGIIGLHAYHIIAQNSMEQCYTQSLKTWEDSKRCLGLQEIVNIEVFYPYTYSSFNNIDILIREAMVKDYGQMNGFISGFMIVYIVLYVVGGTFVGWRIKHRLEEEMTDWRKMLRQIPFVVGNESKLIKSFLQKYRKDI